MQKNEKIKNSFVKVRSTLRRLEEALVLKEDNPLLIDGTVQRFEFTLEAFWKLLKRLLLNEKIDALSPKMVMQEAYKLHWLEDESLWLGMLNDRNLMSHIYEESTAKEIFERIKKYYPEMRKVFDKLQEKFGKNL